jgi:arginyl-tRNA synthetase
MQTAAQVRDRIEQDLAHILKGLGIDIGFYSVPLEYPGELAHGDYATGIALKYAKQLGKNPRELADMVVAALGMIEGVAKVDIAGPGFINFILTPEAISMSLEEARTDDSWGSNETLAGQTIMVEYSQPNPFKEFHVGHLLGTVIGESLSRLIESSGARMIRVNYQGDLGVHVACAIWGIRKLGIDPSTADEFGTAYAAGASAYKNDEAAKKEIDDINMKLYQRSDPGLNAMYDAGRAKSLAAFGRIYDVLGTKFDHYFFENETGPIGKEIVTVHPEIFPESDGARIFKGEKYGLHTRVFINAKGLPTYEAKELGLEKLKKDLYPETTMLIIETANEISEYFKVIKAALGLIYPEIAAQLVHVSHGLMKLPTGKMSSRAGNVITGESLINELTEAAKVRAAESRADDHDELAQQIAVGAIKYQILKQTAGKDIIFDRERALSLEGDSGPYLQYAYARTSAIIERASESGVKAKLDPSATPSDLTRLLVRFPEIVARAALEYEPHYLATYLITIASAYNSWYAQVQILDQSAEEAHKVAIVEAVSKTLKTGLILLGIPVPERM